jgi:hypothetical protein
MWFLTWTPFALGHAHNPFLSDYVNVPQGINLLWNTSIPAIGVLLWPITVVWGPVLSDNLITAGALALSAFFAFLCLRRYVANDIACALGALVYGFSPYLMAQDVAHAQVVASAVTIPIAFLLLDEAIVRQRMRPWRLGLVIAALGVVQFFIFEEIFVTELIAAAVVVAVISLTHRDEVRTRARYVLTTIGVAVGVTAAVLAYPLALQLAGPDRVTTVTHDPETYSTDLLNFVLPTATQRLAPSWATSITSRFTGNLGEWDGYLGLPLAVLALVVAVRYWRRPMPRVAFVTAALIALFSLGPHLHVAGHKLPSPLPWWLPAHLPLLQDIQPNRLMIYVFLCAGFVFAFAVERLWVSRRNLVLSALFVGVVAAPLVPAVPLASRPYAVPPYFTGGGVQGIPDGAVVLAVPCPCPTAMDALNWQAASMMRFRVLGPSYFFGPHAIGQQELMRVANSLSSAAPAPLDGAQLATFEDQLRAAGVRAVMLGAVPDRSAATAILTATLGFAPHVEGGIDIWLLPRAIG